MNITDIVPDNKKDIEKIAEIHLKTFEGFFLTFLGKGFLKELYTGYVKHDKSGLFVAEEDGKILGFLAYSEDLGGLYKYLIKKRLIAFAWYSFCAFIRKPGSMMRLLRAFLKPKESIREENYIELASIGVLPEEKGKNIGTRLIEKLQSGFNAEKFAYIKLETDAENNDSVNKFYKKNGFELASSYVTNEGRKMNEYRWKI